MSLAGYNEEPIAKAAEEAAVTARAIQRMPRAPDLAVRVASAVGWSRLVYRLRFTSAAPMEIDKACMPLKKAVLAQVGLHPGAASAAVSTMVWMQPSVAMQIERLVQALNMLNGEGAVRRGLEGAVQQLRKDFFEMSI